MRLVSFLLLASPVTLVGCEPSCAKTCKTLLACEDVETEMTEVEECEASCLVQEDMYENIGKNSTEREAFKELKICIRTSECDAIAAGECYDEEL